MDDALLESKAREVGFCQRNRKLNPRQFHMLDYGECLRINSINLSSMMEITELIPYRATLIGVSIVKANPITGMLKLWGDEFIYIYLSITKYGNYSRFEYDLSHTWKYLMCNCSLLIEGIAFYIDVEWIHIWF